MQPEARKSVVDHLERYLGPISKGWKRDYAGKPQPFSVVLFDHTPIDDVVAFTTLGLSDFPMGRSVSGAPIRLELVVLLRGGAGLPIPDAMQAISNEMIESGCPLLRGHLIGPRGALWEGSRFEAFYVSMPVCLPRAFGQLEAGEERIVFAWLLPVTAQEAALVRRFGWRRFEDELDRSQLDLLDPSRGSIEVEA